MTARSLRIVAAITLAACSSVETSGDNNGSLSANTPPVAQSQRVKTDAGTPKEIVLTGSVADGDSLSFEVLDGPSHGTLEGSAPNLLYIPEAGFSGQDSFTFRVNDGQADSEPAVIIIIVEKADAGPENTRPVAHAQVITIREGQTVSVTLTGSDADGDSLSFDLVSQPEHGELTGGAPHLVYVPNDGFVGSDAFDFVVNDGEEDSEPATVSIEVLANDAEIVNTPPVANPQNLKTEQDRALTISLDGSDADGDELSFRIVDKPKNGELSGTPPQVEYTPNPGFGGSDSFTFVANDGLEDSEPATIAIQVLPEDEEHVNTPPVAKSQELHTLQSKNLEFTLTGSDADGDPLEFKVVDGPEGGELEGDGKLRTYTPFPDFHGKDQFTFVVNDGIEDSEPATVTIWVNGRPVAEDAEVAVNGGSFIVIAPAGSDPEDEALTFKIVKYSKNGNLVNAPEGWKYTPEQDFHGLDEFQYVASDGKQHSEPATVSIRVNARPVAENLEVLVNQDSSVFIELEGTDTDDDVLSFSILTPPNNGTLVAELDLWEYSPNTGFYGEDTFQYVANDGKQDSEPATVNIRVNGRPSVEEFSLDVNQDSSVLFDLLGSDPDGDDLTFSFPIYPRVNHGTLASENDRWRYTPNPGFHGEDRFFYLASDGNLGSSLAKVTIRVNAQPTVEVESSVVTVEDELVFIPVQAEDQDDDPVTLVVLTQPSNGTLTIGPSGFTYTPSEGFYGTDSFEFVATDGKMDSKPATVSVTVRSRPRVDDLAVHVLVNGQVSITPSGRSLEDNAFTFQLVDSPSGDLDTSGPTWLYSPLEDFTGEDSFTFRATDEFGTQSLLATVSITVHSESFQVSGFASGILSAGAELMLNGDERIELPSDGGFQFSTPVFPGESYTVELMAEPTKQLCYLENAEGTVSEGMLDVSLHCRSWKGPVHFRTGGHGFINSGDLEITYNSLGDGVTVWTMGNPGTDPGANRSSTLWGAVYSAATGTWSPPSLISDDGSNVAVKNPQLLIADDGEKWVFWEQCDEFSTETEECGFSIRAAQMPAAGNSWSEPMVVREPQGEILQYGAAFSANSGQGRIVLVTYERDDKGTEEDLDDTYAVISVESGATVGEWHEQTVDTFPHNFYIDTMFIIGNPEFLKLASYSGEVAALWTQGLEFKHSRYTNNGWTTPYVESDFTSASIGVAPNGDVLVIGRRNGSGGVTPGLLARWFRALEDGEVGEKGWDPELETIFEHDWLTNASPLLSFAPDGSAMVAWGLRSPMMEGTVMAVRYTGSSGWLPVQDVAYHNSDFSVVDMVRDWNGNAFLYMSKVNDSLVVQYSKTSDSWEAISLETGNGDDYVIAPQPDGKVTVLFRDKNDDNRARTVHFD